MDKVERSGALWAKYGERVRQVRTQAGIEPQDLTLREVCDPGAVEAVESGRYAPSDHLARYLEEKIGAKGVLLDAWARARIQSLLDEDADITKFERHAHQIRHFDPGAFPDPFRTADYAHALTLGSMPLSRDRSAIHRAERRSAVLMHSAPPNLCLVVDASVVRETVGDRSIMAAQLSRVAEAARRDHISVHVIPSDTDRHPCRSSAFRLLSFSPHHQIAYVPAPCGPGQLVTDADQIIALTDLFETLKGEALPRGASLALLQQEIERRQDRPKQLTSGTGGMGSGEPVGAAPATAGARG